MSVDQIQNLSLVAEFNKAQLGGEIEPMAFEFQVPPQMQRVDEFLPEDIRWLGKPVPKFLLRRSRREPGHTRLDGWEDRGARFLGVVVPSLQRDAPRSRTGLSEVQGERQGRFCGRQPGQAGSLGRGASRHLHPVGRERAIARDPEQHGYAMLGVQAYPTSLIVGPDGAVEFRQSGGDRRGLGAVLLSARLETLLAGESLHQKRSNDMTRRTARRKGNSRNCWRSAWKDDLYVFRPQEIPRAEIVPRSDPKSLTMTQLWSSTELAAPGNVLVVECPDQPPRILVLEEGKSIAEMATRGNVVSTKSLGVPPEELVFFLRSAAGGRRRTPLRRIGHGRPTAGPPLGRRLQPAAQLSQRRSGKNDTPASPTFASATSRATASSTMVVSYLGIVGVQGVSLDGERIWKNKRAIQSVRLALLGPDDQGRRSILSMNLPEGSPSTLVVLDSDGEDKGEFSLPNRSVAWIEAADLDGDGQPEICGLAPVEGGHMEAVGLNLEGEELWSYPLPPGVHEHEIEAVTAGKLLPGSSGQWLLPAADGTIHILDAGGKPIDVFAYGKRLTGLATAEWDGKAVLLVSTSEGVDAWQVEPPKRPLIDSIGDGRLSRAGHCHAPFRAPRWIDVSFRATIEWIGVDRTQPVF